MDRKEKTNEKNDSFQLIYEVVKKIPYGTVATYGQVAALAGNRRWSRVVGYALHANPDPEHIPCFRVVNRFGETSKAFAFGEYNLTIKTTKSDYILILALIRILAVMSKSNTIPATSSISPILFFIFSSSIST